MSITRRLDMDNPADITACSEDWNKIAKAIGCEVYGFNNERSAQLRTPDGDIIRIGEKFRAVIEVLAAGHLLERARNQLSVIGHLSPDADPLVHSHERGASIGLSQEIDECLRRGVAAEPLRITDITTKELLDKTLEAIFTGALRHITTEQIVGHLRFAAAYIDAGLNAEYAVNVRMDTGMNHSELDTRTLICCAGSEALSFMPRAEITTLLRQKADEQESALREHEAR